MNPFVPELSVNDSRRGSPNDDGNIDYGADILVESPSVPNKT